MASLVYLQSLVKQVEESHLRKDTKRRVITAILYVFRIYPIFLNSNFSGTLNEDQLPDVSDMQNCFHYFLLQIGRSLNTILTGSKDSPKDLCYWLSQLSAAQVPKGLGVEYLQLHALCIIQCWLHQVAVPENVLSTAMDISSQLAASFDVYGVSPHAKCLVVTWGCQLVIWQCPYEQNIGKAPILPEPDVASLCEFDKIATQNFQDQIERLKAIWGQTTSIRRLSEYRLVHLQQPFRQFTLGHEEHRESAMQYTHSLLAELNSIQRQAPIDRKFYNSNESYLIHQVMKARRVGLVAAPAVQRILSNLHMLQMQEKNDWQSTCMFDTWQQELYFLGFGQ